MADAKKANWIPYGLVIALGLSILSSSLGILVSRFSTKLSEFSLDLTDLSLERSESGLSTIAPENLARAPESFRRHLQQEAPHLSVEEMTKTRAWSTLQEDVSAYAQRLELLERQMRDISMHDVALTHWRTRVSLWVSGLGIASSVGLPVFLILTLRQRMARTPPAAA